MKRDRRPASQLTKDELKARILRRAKHVFRECEQAIIDGEYWNGLPHNQCHTPVDLEGFRVNRAWALGVLKEFGVEVKSRLTQEPSDG